MYYLIKGIGRVLSIWEDDITDSSMYHLVSVLNGDGYLMSKCTTHIRKEHCCLMFNNSPQAATIEELVALATINALE